MTSTNSNDPTTSLSGLVSSLPDFWQHAPELYFFRIEATFHSAKITRETDKYYNLVEALPPTILSQVQTLLRDPPSDVPYTRLKADLLRLTSVSDRQRYHAPVKEVALGDRKPSELLRRMRSLLGNMQIDEKFFKEMFLERLPTSVQTILASGSDDLDISKLAEMADRMMEVEHLSSPTIAQVSQPLNVSTSDLAELKSQIAQLSATVAAGGSVVECSPATWAARVRFPAGAREADFIPSSSENMGDPTVEDTVFREESILKELKSLKECKSPGPDEIPAKLLFELAQELAKPLPFLCQKSFDAGILPTDWKTANITPLYKSGSRALATNYRAVSLTSICCKVMEKTIEKDLMTYLETNNLLSNAQYGFRKLLGRRVNAAELSGNSTGRIFYVRRFLVDTGAQISVIPPTPADRRCPNRGLYLQAVNSSPIATFGFLSLSLDIGLRRLFPWIFVVADIPCAILGADFLAAFDLLVDCRQSCLHDRTTNLTVRGTSSSDASRQLAVLDPEPENPFRQLLAKYPALARPNFNVSIPPHDVVHHIRTTGPPVFSRPHRLAPTCLAASKAEFEHML
ncbi:hypothetical protein SprV_1002845100 [Sparganum proliferum]